MTMSQKSTPVANTTKKYVDFVFDLSVLQRALGNLSDARRTNCFLLLQAELAGRAIRAALLREQWPAD